MLPSAQTFLFAFLGGILPACLWLWFWLQEDRLHPEPRGLILLSFLAGMAAVVIAYPLEKFTQGFNLAPAITIIVWAITEELLKYGAAYRSALRKSACDEPVDALIYLITVALGFAALENSLFLITVIAQGDIATSIVTGNLRFIGAGLLHILSSAMIGTAIALSYYKTRARGIIYRLAGVVTAVVLHSIFNLFIMKGDKVNTFIVFYFVWAAIIILLVAFEKVKQISASPRA